MRSGCDPAHIRQLRNVAKLPPGLPCLPWGAPDFPFESGTAVKILSVPMFKRLSLLAWVLAAGSAVAGSGASPQRLQPVGTVMLQVGESLVVSAAGASAAVQRGSEIYPGDRIETSEGGHVHIRFVDGALVSVRPTSRLVVEDYQYDPQRVSASSVRFRLEKGVTRAISGAAAEGARERFRLNTPLVAIGVRGTDFVVRTGANETTATVNQGAIVMAPFGQNCLPQAFGPCGSPSARLLSADMGNMLVEFKSSQLQPEVKAFAELVVAPNRVASARMPTGSDLGESHAVVQLAARSVADEAATSVLVQDSVRHAVVAGSANTDGTPPGGVPTVPALPAQVAWGRWADIAVFPSDFTQQRVDASQGREPTVGNKDFILYRTDTASGTLAPDLGNVNFALRQSHAQFQSAAGVTQQAAVQSGTLAINFGTRQFNTALALSSAATGNVSLQAAGFVRDDGIFNLRIPNQSLAGATALDGKSAGYFFEKAAAGGTLSGITLWGR